MRKWTKIGSGIGAAGAIIGLAVEREGSADEFYHPLALPVVAPLQL
jgi:hypothetical protein